MTEPTFMNPIDLWPPKPKEYRNSYPCRATAGMPVTYEICTGINTSSARNRICQGCACPWRICYQCTLERMAHPAMRDIDPNIGLCPIHLEGYLNTVPPVRPIRMVKQNRKPVPNPTEGQASDPLSGFTEEELLAIGKRIGELTPWNQRIINLLASGLGRPQVAEKLALAERSLSITLFHLGKTLKLNVDHLPGQKVENLISIMVSAYRKTHPVCA